jgi:hypothetical protein
MIKSDSWQHITVHDKDGNDLNGAWSGLNTQTPVFTLSAGKTFESLNVYYVYVSYVNMVEGKVVYSKVKYLVKGNSKSFMLNGGIVSMMYTQLGENIMAYERDAYKDKIESGEINGSPIQSLSVSQVGANEILISWTVTEDSKEEDYEYEVYRIYKDSNDVEQIELIEENVETTSIKEEVPRKTSTYYVLAVSEDGSKTFKEDKATATLTIS